MKLRILTISTALVLVSLWTPLAAAQRSLPPPSVAEREAQVKQACAWFVDEQLKTLPAASDGRDRHFLVREPSGAVREVTEDEFRELAVEECRKSNPHRREDDAASTTTL